MVFLKGLTRIRIVFGVFLFATILLLSQSVSASTISGYVYDKQRNPLPEIDVELLDDYYRQINRTQTDGAGKYQFNSLPDGRYTVRVLAFRYDLIDQSQLIEIDTISVRGAGTGNGYYPADFYLLPKKGGLAESELGVIFAQEIPQEAKKIYEKAIDNISKKRVDEGILGLREAVNLFPTYYSALNRLGMQLSIKGEYGEAVKFLMKAVEVNDKSATSLYYLGYSLYKLNYNSAALVALNQAYVLAPSSTQVLFVLGKVERLEGKYTEAEKHLVQAKKLSAVSVADIHWELAQLYGNDLKKYKEAADELELYLKARKVSDEEEKKLKKVLSNLREKAKTQASKE